MSTPESLWIMRKQFAMQTATVTFLTFFGCLINRTPGRYHFSRKTGQMYMSEVLLGELTCQRHCEITCADLTGFTSGQPTIASTESVPFRLTPNMQHFITRTGIEGVVVACITAIAKSLSAPEFELDGTLHLFVRDEVSSPVLKRSKRYVQY